MRVLVESTFPAPPDRVWQALRQTATLRHVAAPLIRFRPAEPGGLPAEWDEGSEARLRLYLFGIVPLGRHHIRVVAVDRARGEIRSEESGRLVPVWNHVIRVAPAGGSQSRYADEVELRAGLRTPFVWAFAQLFYRHRQRRWKRLLAREAEGR